MFLAVLLVPLYKYLGAMWTAVVASILIGLIMYIKRLNNYFPNNGIKSLPIYWPFLGNSVKLILQREHFVDFAKNLYKQMPDEKYFGFRSLTSPTVIIKDLEVIKQVGIKDFDYFMEHLNQIDENVDPLFGNTIVALKGQKWRDMRATLSPAFTSFKMRGMFDFVGVCGDQMAKFFLIEAKKPEFRDKEYVDVELKDIFTRYTNDVIASSAFGINVNSLQDRDNEFYTMGKKYTNFRGIYQLLKFFFLMAVPRLMKFFNIKVFDQKISKFFRDLVNDSMKMRDEKGIVRHDMIHLLMEAKKGSLKHDASKTEIKEVGFAAVEESEMGKESHNRVWTDDELIAQAVIFFLAGFDTSSNLLCFIGYELAKNPDIQKRLQKEIDEIAEKNNGKIKYDDLQHMKYMDMVVSETLRYWPPAILTDRKCVKSYTLPPSNDSSTTGGKLNPGDGVWFPIYPIHHDPQYYKDPEKFDPERFSEENEHLINPSAYLPFGIGPRNCIVWTDDELIAQAVIFFLAGFDTSSNLLCFIGYELAKNPDIQKRLQKEIDEIAEKNNGKIKYDDLQHMKYMDMVVSETLRYWPPAILTDRKCVKSYTLPPSNDSSTTGGKLNPGDGVWFPIYPIHHDPQYYKDPEKFDPERFSEENEHLINPSAYLPFGIGPRNCIGSRFALMEVKAVIFYLLLHFDMIVTDKTPIPLILNKKSFSMYPKEGFGIGLKPRTLKQ